MDLNAEKKLLVYSTLPMETLLVIGILLNCARHSLKTSLELFSSVGGLMNGSISVFSINTGGVINVLENEETISESMPISRLRCKPSGDNNVTILAATYVSGHLRYNMLLSDAALNNFLANNVFLLKNPKVVELRQWAMLGFNTR